MSKNKKNESNFLVQGSILAIASIVSRIIGLVYRIPLTAIIGDRGNDYYSAAFEIYNILLIMSSFSLPLAVSKMVSSRVAKGQRKNAYRVFKGALIFAIVIGTSASLILYFGASYFSATIMNTPLSIFALKVLVPNILFVAILGTIRGYFQGLGTMMPSAVSQIIEQIINAIVSVAAAYFLFSYGMKIGGVLGDKKHYSAAYGAAGGTFGTVLGSLVGLLFVIFLLFSYQRILKRQMLREKNVQLEPYSYIFKIIIFTIVPVLLSTTIYNISSVLDQSIFKHIAELQGYALDDISKWNGIYSVKYKTLINIPLAIASAIAASSVPSLSAAYAQRDRAGVRAKINSAIRFVMIIAYPCAVGMGVLASPIMQLVYNDSSAIAGGLLRAGALSIIFFSLSTLSNGLLQGINRMKAPVINAAIALILHIVCLLVMMFGFRLNIYAVVYANALFAFFMCALNALSIKKYSGYHQEIRKTFLIPTASSAVMGIVVYLTYKLLYVMIHSNAIATIAAIVIGAITYFVTMLLLKGLAEEELLRFPKGHVLVNIARKMHFLR